MKKRYATVLIGASYYALGYASAHADCLILGQTQTVGDEFHACLRPVEASSAGRAEMDTALGTLLREYGAWTDAGFDVLKAQPVAHEYAARLIAKGQDILLDTRVLSVAKTPDGFAVEYFCNEGACRVEADSVLDTTTHRATAPRKARCTGKTLNAFTVCNEPGFDAALRAVCPDCRILAGFGENERLLAFPAAADEEISSAYRRVVDLWKQAFPRGEEKILFMAQAFDAVYEPCGQSAAAWLGTRFAHPATAFLKGRDAI